MISSQPSRPLRPRPPFRLGDDARQSLKRIARWSMFLAIIGLLSVLLSGLVGVGIGLLGDDPVRMGIGAAIAAYAVVILLPTIAMFRMSRRFGGVAFPANAASLIAPLRSLRVVLVWFVALGALGHTFTLIVAILNLSGPGVLGMLGLDKRGETVRSMKEIAAAIDDYARENHTYPNAADYDQLLILLDRADGKNALPPTDAWGRSFRFKVQLSSYPGPEYELMSLGADGDRQDPWREEKKGVVTPPEDVDIIIESGVFVEGPEEFRGVIAMEDGK